MVFDLNVTFILARAICNLAFFYLRTIFFRAWRFCVLSKGKIARCFFYISDRIFESVLLMPHLMRYCFIDIDDVSFFRSYSLKNTQFRKCLEETKQKTLIYYYIRSKLHLRICKSCVFAVIVYLVNKTKVVI